AVTAPAGRLVSTADMLVENEDFTRDWVNWSLLGRKAAAQNLADVCATGAKPHGLLVSLALPDDTRIADLAALFTGILAEAGRGGERPRCGPAEPAVGGPDRGRSGAVRDRGTGGCQTRGALRRAATGDRPPRGRRTHQDATGPTARLCGDAQADGRLGDDRR